MPLVSISIGAAQRQECDTLETLMARSDAAMYAAKRERQGAGVRLTDESEGEGDAPD